MFEFGLIVIERLAHRHRRAFALAGLAARERLSLILGAPKVEDRTLVRLVVVVGIGEFPGPRSSVTVACLDRPRADAFVAAVE
jgi:hypothetical protein